jgi:YHS domain-containing protein
MHRSIVACTLLLIGSLIFVVELAIAGPTTAPSTPSTQPVNKMCAVMREDKIDPKVTYVYQGKTIGFCCEDCVPEFRKDPEKYMKDLK